MAIEDTRPNECDTKGMWNVAGIQVRIIINIFKQFCILGIDLLFTQAV